MPRRLLTRLAEGYDLRVPVAAHNYTVWSKPPTGSFDDLMYRSAQDPVERAMVSCTKQRGRNGAHALALGALRNAVVPDGSDARQRAVWLSAALGSSAPRLMSFRQRRPVGRRLLPEYRSLVMGGVYVHSEIIPTISRWQNHPDGRSQVIRFNVYIPREVSPRGTNVYGDHLVIEQPAMDRFLRREGWRIWVASAYDPERPRSKLAQLRALEEEDTLSSLFHFPDFADGHAVAYPCLINWCVDSRGLRLP